MPIAFDPPTHAPHGAHPARGTRSVEDDPSAGDIFTQLLLAAAGVQDATAPADPTSPTTKDDARGAEPSVLSLPLPASIVASPARPPSGVTIVAAEKVTDVRTAAVAGAARPAVEASLRTIAAMPASRADGAPAKEPAPSTGVGTDGKADAPSTDARPSAPPTADLRDADTPAASLPEITRDTPALRTPAPHAPAPAMPASALAALLAVPAATAAAGKAAQAKAADSAAAALAGLTAPAARPAPPIHLETISAPAFTPGWQDETVSKLASIVMSRNERAEIKLNPAELGPVNVRVEMRADQVSVQIVAASPETRTALEQSLPQLRDLLASQGITLGQATVHDGATPRDARPDAWSTGRAASSDDLAPVSGSSDTVHLVARRPDRLVDVFA